VFASADDITDRQRREAILQEVQSFAEAIVETVREPLLVLDKDLHAYAEQLGIDVERFDKDLAEHVHAPRVREDFMSGVRSGVNGTPSFYVNGARHDDSYDFETLLAALERAAA